MLTDNHTCVAHFTYCTVLHCQHVCCYVQVQLTHCLQITVIFCPTKVQALPSCLVSLWTVCMQAPHANGFQQRTLADIILQKIQDKERAQGQASTSGYAPLHKIHSSRVMHHCDQIQAQHRESRVYSSELRVSRCDLKGTKLRWLE